MKSANWTYGTRLPRVTVVVQVDYPEELWVIVCLDVELLLQTFLVGDCGGCTAEDRADVDDCGGRWGSERGCCPTCHPSYLVRC